MRSAKQPPAGGGNLVASARGTVRPCPVCQIMARCPPRHVCGGCAAPKWPPSAGGGGGGGGGGVPSAGGSAPQGPPRQTMLDQGWRRFHPLSPLVRSGRGLVAVLALAG